MAAEINFVNKKKTDPCGIFFMSEVVVICVDSMTPGCLFKDESLMKDLKALGCKKHSDAEVCR